MKPTKGTIITAGLLTALLIALPNKQTPAPQLNNSETVVTTQPTESAKQPPSNASEHLATPVTPEAPAIKEVEQTKPEPETPKAQTKAEVQAPVLSPKEQAKATLEDLGQGDAWYAVEYIGFKESSWNPHAINNIGACGLFQALPCEKMRCELSDIPCQVRWATKYATERYGSWHNAYNFWKKNSWW